jgi:hypothetical protein
MPSEMEVKEFVTRIAQIPPVENVGEGFDAIREIGEEINKLWGKHGMQLVLKYYREHIPRNSATIPPMIDAIWDGIGSWQH